MDNQELLSVAALAGAATCFTFRGQDIRGDYAALAFIATSLSLYSVLCATLASPLLATLAVCLAYGLTVWLITVAYRLSPWHPLAAYPGPYIAKITGLWLSYISFTGKRYQILDDLHTQHGPFLRVGPGCLSINSPTATSLYLSTEKSEAYRLPKHNGAVALFFKQDTSAIHRDRRRVWSEFFTRSSIAGLIPQLERRTWELVQCFERRQEASQDKTVNFPETMYHWSHDFMGDMVFGGCSTFELMRNGDPQGIIHTGKMATAMMDSLGQTPWLLDILWHMPFTKKMHLLDDHAARMMKTRVKSKDLPEYRDLASYWIAAGIPQHELETDAVVAIVGGSDNTSITVSIAIYFLLSHREYYDRLYAELKQTFPDPMASVNLDELTTLPFLNAVIHETLRLASPYFNPRVVPKGGLFVDGQFIPEKTVVALAAHSQQISEANFYPAPKHFHPERWLPEGLGPDTVTNKAVLASFSYGPHHCIGRVLAYHQMRFALARILLAFDIEFAPGFDVAGFYDGILNMRTMFLEQDLRVRVHRREGVDLAKVPV
ncbi:cytochrome P450 [Trametes versicolor FP-101664 SS1]|uniref:cytochrome P450 n=1 Tax=Trametes versicolor (strain FP-101664) TaxID=717944 RepID=UPI0004621F4C|nr:cytochrome P450 [Trametes versicolor FP-101664 SS1]EIW57872.1 cytochrome P450 [Trametes versicolor FP-101664 SS1]